MFTDILRPYLEPAEGFFFVHAGANNGYLRDPFYDLIREYRWKGLALEPVPEVFEQLQSNYRNFDFTCVQAAIGLEEGEKPLYTFDLEQPGCPSWLHQISSFDLDTIRLHKVHVPELEQYLKTIRVPVMTFETLFRKYKVNNVDLLSLDVEGYEQVLLENFPFEHYKPQRIIYEHRHFDPGIQERINNHLTRQGYALVPFKFDTLAVLGNKS